MTWQVGDLAVCVDTREDELGKPVPLEAGRVYRVWRVRLAPLMNDKFGTRVGLDLEGAPCRRWVGWSDTRFRKIRPDEHEACEPEFVTLLQRIKTKEPVVS